MPDEEKDIFDQFREQSESVVEQPSGETWQRLESRLADARKRRPKRRVLPTYWLVATVTLVLILSAGAATWILMREQEARLQGEKLFAELDFLRGKWSSLEGAIVDELIFERKTPQILRGDKTLKFKDIAFESDSLIFQNLGKRNILIFQNQKFDLKIRDYQTFIFTTENGATAKLRRSEADKFTLSFDAGRVFVYRKIN